MKKAMKDKYQVIIIGAGPAGLFAAYELAQKGIGEILLLEKGKKALARSSKEVLCGVGGAGLYSDGKLNFTPRHGKTDLTEFMDLTSAQNLIDELEGIFKKFGMDGQTYPSDMDKALFYKNIAQEIGLNLQIIKEKHLGSDKLPGYMAKMEDFLLNKGVEIATECEGLDLLVENDRILGVKTTQGEIRAEKVIAAPGRSGNRWLTETLGKLGLKMEQKPIEVGVRVETDARIMAEICQVLYDPVFFWRTKVFDDQLRTFCTNPTGFVAAEKYKDFTCVNGHAYSEKKSTNANFALLDRVSLTEPVTDTIAYGESICILASTIGGGRPVLQSYTDLKRHRRSTWERLKECPTEPTLKEVTPGDIEMALPHRIVTNLVEGLETLDKIFPGLAGEATLLYAPEVKFFSVRPKVSANLETEIKGLFVAGDGAGVSGNIVGAAATGIIAARGILA